MNRNTSDNYQGVLMHYRNITKLTKTLPPVHLHGTPITSYAYILDQLCKHTLPTTMDDTIHHFTYSLIFGHRISYLMDMEAGGL